MGRLQLTQVPSVAIVLVLAASASADSKDRGYFTPDKFRHAYKLADPTGLSSGEITLYTNGEVSRDEVLTTYVRTIDQALKFLDEEGFTFHPIAFPHRAVVIKFIPIGALNSPEFFVGAEQSCKRGINANPDVCKDFYMGRTFYTDATRDLITTYIGFSRSRKYRGEYSWQNSLAHELFHQVIAQTDLKFVVGDDTSEHDLLDRFMRQYIQLPRKTKKDLIAGHTIDSRFGH